MSNSPWEGFGSVMGDVIKYLYIYLGVVVCIVTAIIIMSVSYVKKRRKQANESGDAAKNVAGRIVIYVLVGLLLLVVLPFAAEPLLR